MGSLNLWNRPCDTVTLASLFTCADQFSARSSDLIATICSFLSRSSSLLIHVIFLHISTCFDSFAKSSRAYQLLSADSSEVHGKNEQGSFLHLKNHTQHTLISVVLYSRVTTDNWNWRELQHLCDKPGHGVTNHQGYYGSAYWWHIPGMLGTLS